MTDIKRFVNTYVNNGWNHVLIRGLSQQVMLDNLKQITKDKATCQIFPNQEDLLNAFKYCNHDDTKVVILGQDPYPSVDKDRKPVAHGLAFSYLNRDPNKIFVPKSLINIFDEVQSDIYPGESYERDTNLTRWAVQGVLLLNTALTVPKGRANAHAKLWMPFTNHIINYINLFMKNVVFILWGSNAHKYSRYILSDHLVIKSSHPSPLSYKTQMKEAPMFYDSKPFSKANDYITEHYGEEYKIIW